MSDSVRPHRRQPTRLPRPWDSPGTGPINTSPFQLEVTSSLYSTHRLVSEAPSSALSLSMTLTLTARASGITANSHFTPFTGDTRIYTQITAQRPGSSTLTSRSHPPALARASGGAGGRPRYRGTCSAQHPARHPTSAP